MLEIANSERFKITTLYTAFKASRTPSFRFYGEAHDFWETVFVTSGVIGISAGKEIATLRAGQAVMHPPMEFHRIWSEAGTAPEYIIFSFSAQNMPQLRGHTFKLSNEALEELQQLLLDFRASFSFKEGVNIVAVKEGHGLSSDKAIGALEQFVLKMVSSEPDTSSHDNSANARTYAKIVSTIDENISKKLTVGQIASLCFLSESNMKRIFSEYAGCGIMKYVALKKANYATELLQGGMSVSEVASFLGFPDRAYFSTWYKRVTGSLPGKKKLK